MTDIRRLQIGQVVDFCIDYNNRNKQNEPDDKAGKKKVKSYRLASDAEISAFFG